MRQWRQHEYQAELCPRAIVLDHRRSSVAAFIAIGLLTGVAFLFQRDGAPLEKLAAAERACTPRVYVSEREACMREWLAAARARNVASK